MVLHPSSRKKHVFVQVYGKKQIVMERNEVEAIKKFEDPGLYLIGFKPIKMLKIHHHIRPSVFIYPEENMVKGIVACLTDCTMHRTHLITTGVQILVLGHTN